MGKRKFYMVLDTETVSDAKIPFDIAYTLMGRDCNIINQKNYIVEEIGGTPTGNYLMQCDSFTKSKSSWYIENIPKLDMRPFAEIQKEINQTLKELENFVIVAYNAKFDITALNKYSNIINNTDFFLNDVNVWDLWNIALHSICNSSNYVEFALLNNFITEAGNVKSSAEAVFNYLLKDGAFKEAHTALADTEIEAKILQACFKRKKKLETDYAGMMVHHPIWKDRLRL